MSDSHRRIIATCGFATSGKSAVCNILRDRHGFTVLSFAETLKAMAIDGYVIGGKKWYWDGVSKGPIERINLQYIGDVEREKDRNVFVRAVIGRLMTTEGDVCIGDARYSNEIVNLQHRGALIWRVVRDGVIAANGHVSESEHLQFKPSSTIYNNGTLETLAETVGYELSQITH